MMPTGSSFEVLTEDVRTYTLSFLHPSALRCWSLTCCTYLPSEVQEETPDLLCCECDDLELFQKLVANGHQPTRSHSILAAESGSFRIYDFLYTLDKGLANIRDTHKEMFSCYLSCLDRAAPTEAVLAELEVSRKTCRELKLDEGYAEKWYRDHHLSVAANIYLVVCHTRLTYYCDVYDTEEMQRELTRVILEATDSTLRSVTAGMKAPIFFHTHHTKEVRDVLVKGGNTMAALLGYGYTGENYSGMEGMYVVSFDVSYANDERQVQLYGYKCPVDAYIEEVREKDLQRLKEFRRYLTPIGVRVEYVAHRL